MLENNLDEIPLEELLKTPDYDQYFPEIVELSPNFGDEAKTLMAKAIELMGAVATSPDRTRDILDRISIFWQKSHIYLETAVNLSKVTKLADVPEADRRLAKLYLQDYISELLPAIQAIQNFVLTKKENRKWGENCLPIYEAINFFEDSDNTGFYEESITVLLETISKTKKKWKDEPTLRKKIGQEKLFEVFEAIKYYQLAQQVEYQDDTDEVEVAVLELGESTIDSPEVERNEFEAAINDGLWTDGTKKALRKPLLRLINAMDDEDFTANAHLIWAAIQGKTKIVDLGDGDNRKSTIIDLVVAAEDMLAALQSAGVIDWEPDEEDDLEDDLDENLLEDEAENSESQ